MKDKIKSFFSKKTNIIALVAIALIIIIILILALRDREEKKFALNEIYNVYPEEVRELYSNMVEISCGGDLHLNVSLDSGEVSVSQLDQNNLLDYMFSYLDKNDGLVDNMEVSLIQSTTKKLFDGELDFTSKINNYVYGDYSYTVKDGKVSRAKSECNVDTQYVSHLYGYSYNTKKLSIDVNIGYLKDGNLYDLANNLLGKYNGEVAELEKLFGPNSYYRYNYVLDGKIYKLTSVEWNNRV